ERNPSPTLPCLRRGGSQKPAGRKGRSVTTPSPRLRKFAGALTLLYLLIGVAAMWWLAPRVPYADGWRFLGHFLQAPFPHDILAPDNGHHEVLPNAVRVLELHAFAAGQWLQVVVGIALALATVLNRPGIPGGSNS